MEPESEEVQQDKMSNFALHLRTKKLEILLAAVIALLAALGYEIL